MTRGYQQTDAPPTELSKHAEGDAGLASIVRLMAREAAQGFLEASVPTCNHGTSKTGDARWE